MTRRLTPLIDDSETPSAVRDVLQAGRDQTLSAQGLADYDFEAGLARHMAVIQAGAPMPDWAKGLESAATGGGSATTTAVAAGAGATALGGVVWLAVPIVTAAVVAAALWARQAEPASAPTPAPAVGMHPIQPAVSSATPVSAPVRPAPVVAAPELAPAAESAELTDHHTAVPAARTRSPRTSVPQGKVRMASSTAPSASAVPAASGADLFARARPVTGSAQPVAPSERPLSQAPLGEAAREAANEPAPKPAAAKLDDARLEREMSMLAVAQRVLHGDPSRALSLVRQSAHEFGDTMFAPERGQLELLALVKLGRMDEAKRLARPYLARYPNGPFSDRVRRSLASGRVER